MKMHERYPVFANNIALRTYLYKSVYNGAMTLRGRQKRFLPLPDGQMRAPDEQDAWYAELESRVFEDIFRTVENLSPVCRRVFEMSHFEHRSIEDISAMLGIAHTSVKTHRQRAKKLLREQLRDV